MARKGDSCEMERTLARLKNSRTGKKGSITKRMRRIEALVDEGGSRRVIRSLVTALGKVFEELQDVCAQISSLAEEVDENNCIEDIRGQVEECIAVAEDNLEARKDDPDSTGSIASLWVREYESFVGDQDAGTEYDAESRLGTAAVSSETRVTGMTELLSSKLILGEGGINLDVPSSLTDSGKKPEDRSEFDFGPSKESSNNNPNVVDEEMSHQRLLQDQAVANVDSDFFGYIDV